MGSATRFSCCRSRRPSGSLRLRVGGSGPLGCGLGKAIDEAGIGKDLEAWSIPDTADWYGLGFDAVSLFQNGIFARAYTREDSYIGLGVSLDLREARLIFWFGTKNEEDLAADHWPQDGWDAETWDYGYRSQKGLARIEAGCVPLKRLKAATASALAVITG